MSPLPLVVLISRIAVDAFRLFGSEFGVKSPAWTMWLNVEGEVAIGSVHGTGKAGIGIAGLRSFRPEQVRKVFPFFLGHAHAHIVVRANSVYGAGIPLYCRSPPQIATPRHHFGIDHFKPYSPVVIPIKPFE